MILISMAVAAMAGDNGTRAEAQAVATGPDWARTVGGEVVFLGKTATDRFLSRWTLWLSGVKLVS